MALSGTLKDFGIADILQLIGHQTKTGRLTLKTGTDEVEVFFVDGNVVFASEKSRDSRDLLGSLLLRAELVSKERLDDALAIQQRTLKRLGDILVDNASVTHAQLAQMMRLQTTETLYKLFSWKNGSYEFSQETVDAAKSTFEPIRSESVLLEGFRRMDEWPALKRNVPWTDATFETLKELDTAGLQSIDDGLDDGHGEDGQPAGRHKLVYKLATLGKNGPQGLEPADRMGVPAGCSGRPRQGAGRGDPQGPALDHVLGGSARPPGDHPDVFRRHAAAGPLGRPGPRHLPGGGPGAARSDRAPDRAGPGGAAGERARGVPDGTRRVSAGAPCAARGRARERARPALPVERALLLSTYCSGVCFVAAA